MSHQATFETREFEWIDGFDQERTEPRIHWTCSCGRTNSDAGHGGGYTTMHKAEVGHRLHAQRTSRKG